MTHIEETVNDIVKMIVWFTLMDFFNKSIRNSVDNYVWSYVCEQIEELNK